MASALFFVLALAASAAARPSNRSSVSAEQGEPDGKIDLKSTLILEDMRLVDEQINQVKGAPISFEQFRWPGGVVPYQIDRSLSNAVNVIGRAFQEYAVKTCIRFVPKGPQLRNYIYIFPGEGCYSNVGMINQGQQPVSLGQGCLPYGTVVHELGHAIGLFHEQNRYDRDDYLIIQWQNIQRGMEDQFQKVDRSHMLQVTPFDFNSIMLYGDTAFSKDQKSITMVARNGVSLREVYDKPGLSKDDAITINKMYKCDPLISITVG